MLNKFCFEHVLHKTGVFLPILACLLAPYIFMGIRGFQILPCQAPSGLLLGRDPTPPQLQPRPQHPHLLSSRPLFPTELLILSFLLRFPLKGGAPTEMLRALVAITKPHVSNQYGASLCPCSKAAYSLQPGLCPQAFSLSAFLWEPGNCSSETPMKTYRRLLMVFLKVKGKSEAQFPGLLAWEH